jgi:4-hydroxybenzoate polyprenyltransferase
MSRIVAGIELLRPHQWVKNAFVLVGLLFGRAWNDGATVWAALAATLAFCLASGAVYAFNDARDAAQDRGHPDKRTRPVARGALSPAEAIAIAALVGAASLALAAWVSWRAAAIVAVYLGISAAYTLGLKRVPVLDVVVIAAGFMLRLLAGTLGIGIEPSRWLLACGFLLTLFLGFAKRRAEIARLAEPSRAHRAVGAARHRALPLPLAPARRRRRSGRGIAARPAVGGLGGRLAGDRAVADRLEFRGNPPPWPTVPRTSPTSSTSGTRPSSRRRSTR